MATSITGQGIAAYKAPDDALSSESKNAVQNKVIDEELSDVKSAISQLDIEYDPDVNRLFVTVGGIRKGEGVDVSDLLNPVNNMDLDSIVKYYRSSVSNAAQYLQSLGDKYVHNIIATDLHYDANRRHSAAIANLLMDTGLFDKLMILGDITDDNTLTQYNHFIDDGWGEHNGEIIFCLGNHDALTPSGGYPVYDDFYQDFLSKSDYGDGDTLYYMHEDAVHRIRYVVLNTETITENANDPQLAFIQEVMADAGWTVFVLAHRNMAVLPDGYTWAQSLGNQITDAIKTAMESGSASIGGYICGHQHVDIITPVDDKFYHVTLLNDRKEEQNYYDGYSVTVRTNGTNQEHAITLMSINPTIGNVKFFRIGASKTNGTWEYTYPKRKGDIVVENHHSITYNLLNCKTSNPISSVVDGESFTAVISAESGSSFGRVTVTMNGTDITETAYNNGTITIASVTGDVYIKAIALSNTENLITFEGHFDSGLVVDSYSYDTDIVNVTRSSSNGTAGYFIAGVSAGDIYEVEYERINDTGGYGARLDGGKTEVLTYQSTDVNLVKATAYEIKRGIVVPSDVKTLKPVLYSSGKFRVSKRQPDYRELFVEDELRFEAIGDATYEFTEDGKIHVMGTPPTKWADDTNRLLVGISDMISDAVYHIIVKTDVACKALYAWLDNDTGALSTTKMGGGAFGGYNINVKNVDMYITDYISDAQGHGRGTLVLSLFPDATYEISLKLATPEEVAQMQNG